MWLSTSELEGMQVERRSFFGSYESGALKTVESHMYTQYIEEHYAELTTLAMKLPDVDPTLVGDMINDMWLSLSIREAEGNDFDENYINRADNIVDIDSAVANTLIQYSKNSRYHLRYNNKEKHGKHTYEVLSMSQALTGSGGSSKDRKEAGAESAYTALCEASLVKEEKSLADSICDKLSYVQVLKDTLSYLIINTEDYKVSMRTILDNIDMLLERVCDRPTDTVNAPDKDGFLKLLHGAMFSEYTGDFELESNFRLIMKELVRNKEYIMGIYQSVCDELYAVA